MKEFVAISDIHNQYLPTKWKLTPADVLIFCGDYSILNKPSISDHYKFIKFLNEISSDYDKVIIIAGNHDLLFEKNKKLAVDMINENCNNVIYLENKSFTYEGIKIYGTPVQKEFNNWAFNINEEKRKTYYSNIPKDTDILITHAPPYDILDGAKRKFLFRGKPVEYLEPVGCKILRQNVLRVSPKYHIFGHIHESYGNMEIDGINFINCSLLDNMYCMKNKPVRFTI